MREYVKCRLVSLKCVIWCVCFLYVPARTRLIITLIICYWIATYKIKLQFGRFMAVFFSHFVFFNVYSPFLSRSSPCFASSVNFLPIYVVCFFLFRSACITTHVNLQCVFLRQNRLPQKKSVRSMEYLSGRRLSMSLTWLFLRKEAASTKVVNG